jgi:queuine tRNA-ribosyltransferase
MVLDECPPPLERAYNEEALARTHRWAERCRAAHQPARPGALWHRPGRRLRGPARAERRAFLRQLDFPGYAIGGLAVGETKEAMYATLDFTCPALPADKPRYLMGVGAPEDIVEAVARGVDFFDCVLPTRIARNGALLTPDGRINMRNAQYAEDQRPVQADCTCYTCRTFSRAYLRHLYKAGEISALRLGTIHNVHFMLELMRQIRAAIAGQSLCRVPRRVLARFRITDQATRHAQRELRAAAKAQGS